MMMVLMLLEEKAMDSKQICMKEVMMLAHAGDVDDVDDYGEMSAGGDDDITD